MLCLFLDVESAEGSEIIDESRVIKWSEDSRHVTR